MRTTILAVVAGLTAAGSAAAASREVIYGPPPAWIVPAPTPTTTHPPDGAPFQTIYADVQVRIADGGIESQQAYRLKVLKPEALSVGNLTGVWNPSTDDFTVHHLRVHRGGQVIDVLADTRFKVLEREHGLDYAMLDGALTAALQVPGLQVGDEIEFASTTRRRDATFDGRIADWLQLPTAGRSGAYRVRLVWPKGQPLRWQTSRDLGAGAVRTEGGENVLSVELRDPKSSIVAEGAPDRFNVRRMIEFTNFDSWAAVSNKMATLFDRAAVLAPDSPVRAEAARIAASTSDPAARAEAALQLVQDRIRYLYVGLNGGNYRPASADETWTRRFGDCKAKTALLLALLRELGIPAEAVLVNSTGGDAIQGRLPTPGAFDHVLVRARIAGASYWLDGTRSGDRRLSGLKPPSSKWALALRAGAVDLEAVTPAAPVYPQLVEVLDVDASAGFDKPARVRVEEVLRDDGVQQIRTALGGMSADDAQRALRSHWREAYDWAEPESSTWHYDEGQQAIILTMVGTGKPDWKGNDKDGRYLDIYSAGFVAPSELKRPAEQDQSASWQTEFPDFKRWTTVIHLPPASAKWRWEYRAAPVNEHLGGVAYVRHVSFADNVIRTTMSRRAYLPEITPAQAAEIAKRLPDFDNTISRVYQVAADTKDERTDSKDPRALAGAGFILLDRGETDAGVALLDKALAVDPKYGLALLGKSTAAAIKGDTAGALRLAEQAKQADPTLETDGIRVAALLELGRKDDAKAIADRAVAAAAGKPEKMRAAAELLRQSGQDERALGLVDAAIRLAPQDAALLHLRSSINSDLDRYPAALADADAAVRLSPEDTEVLHDRAAILVRLKRGEAALEDLEEVRRMDPLDPGVYLTKSDTLRRLGRKAEARAVIDDLALRDKTGAALNASCWDRALDKVEIAKAESDCAAALKLNPDSAAFWDSSGMVALQAGRFEEAVKRYDKALALAPRLSPSLYGRGVSKLRLGDKAGGEADIAAAKGIWPRVAEDLAEEGFTP